MKKVKIGVIKTYKSKHDYNQSFNNSKVNYKFISNHFIKKKGISKIQMILIKIKDDVMKDLCVDVSLS